MRIKLICLAVFLLPALVLVSSCERKTVTVTEVIKEVSPQDAAYVGSAECGTSGCHEGVYATFRNTGHPYKLNDADSARLPVGQYYPFTSVPNPSDVSWDNISMVIGGFWWKARYIDNEGYILTGANRQYNMVDQQFVSYDAATAPRKPYDCGPCHMTNYVDTGNQGGLAGMVGTWEFAGIQCEECHGPGEFHAAEPYKFAMKIERESEQCGKCHIRGDVEKIPAKSGWVEHHEQWNEMFRTKHASLECVDCHDPHIGLHADNPERESAIRLACETCHLKETKSFLASGINHAGSGAGPGCIDCHMAKTGKSAVGNAATFTGDVHSHSWRINTDPNAAMFTTDGLFANGYITLDFACLQCHTSETKAWAATYASLVHTPDVDETASCFTCHSDVGFGQVVAAIGNEYENSVHAEGENTNRNRLYSSGYQSCEKCHTSEGFIAQVTGVPATGDHFSAISCFTCHAPHSGGEFGVRVTSAVNLADGSPFDRGEANLCASCHQSRRNVNTYVVANVTLSSHWGPHYSNQADMLLGENAYEFAGFSYEKSPHSNVAGNGCIDCHMSKPLHETVGGHSWNMHNEERGFENRSGCNVSTCHNGSVTTLDITAEEDYDADGSVEGVQTEIHGLLDSLHVLLENAGLVDSVGVPVSGRVVTTADSAGTVYNFLFVEEDRSDGVHNTQYAVGLLKSSINFLNTGNPNGAPTGSSYSQLPSMMMKSH